MKTFLKTMIRQHTTLDHSPVPGDTDYNKPSVFNLFAWGLWYLSVPFVVLFMVAVILIFPSPKQWR